MSHQTPDVTFWRSDIGIRLVDAATELALSSRNDAASIALKLKRLFPERSASELNAVIDLVVARAKAAPRLGAWVANALLTTRSVEQASRPEFSRYRAERFRGSKHLLEVGAASGFDTAALARVATRVTALEPDPGLAEMARHNLTIQGITNVEVYAETLEDFVKRASLEKYDALFADPSRRDKGGGRIRGAEEYLPPLSLVLQIPIHGCRAVKISPAVTVELPPAWHHEFLGLGGECLEQTLWANPPAPLPAVHLADVGVSWLDTGEAPHILDRDSVLGGYLYDPHPALVRSGAVGSFYANAGIALLDPSCAYGISDTLLSTPFLRPFRILDSVPYRVETVAKRLHALGWTSRSEIKKRGVDVDPDELRRKLKLPPSTDASSPFGTVLIGRRGESLIAVLAERISSVEESPA